MEEEEEAEEARRTKVLPWTEGKKTTPLINIVADYAFQNARVPAPNLTFEAEEILGRRRRKCEIITDLRCQISRSFLPSSVRIPCQIGRGHEEYPSYRFSRPKSPLLLLLRLLFIHPPLQTSCQRQTRSQVAFRCRIGGKKVVSNVADFVGHADPSLGSSVQVQLGRL